MKYSGLAEAIGFVVLWLIWYGLIKLFELISIYYDFNIPSFSFNFTFNGVIYTLCCIILIIASFWLFFNKEEYKTKKVNKYF